MVNEEITPTERRLKALTLSEQGYLQKEIAEKLNVSANTISQDLKIARKLNEKPVNNKSTRREILIDESTDIALDILYKIKNNSFYEENEYSDKMSINSIKAVTGLIKAISQIEKDSQVDSLEHKLTLVLSALKGGTYETNAIEVIDEYKEEPE